MPTRSTGFDGSVGSSLAIKGLNFPNSFIFSFEESFIYVKTTRAMNANSKNKVVRTAHISINDRKDFLLLSFSICSTKN